MNASTKRNLAVAGFAVLIGLCIAAFFVGKHAGSRKASAPGVSTAPPSAATSPSQSAPPPISASPSPSPSSPPSSSPPSSPSASNTAPSSDPPPSPVASTSPDKPSITIPLHTSVPLSSANESPAVLLPTSCTITGGVATATGTFNPQMYGESYRRAGDVVELYVYSAPGVGDPIQLGELAAEHPVAVTNMGPWAVAVPVDTSFGQRPAQCLVAIQSTHAEMGAPNDY